MGIACWAALGQDTPVPLGKPLPQPQSNPSPAPPGAGGVPANQKPGQTAPAAAPADAGAVLTPGGLQAGSGAPVTLDFSTILQRARQYGTLLTTANLATRIAHEDRVQAKAALLPNVNQFDQFIYTQPNGLPSGVFVANDGPHVYNSWMNVHEDFSFSKRADYFKSIAAEAVTRARADIAARGLISTVLQDYYAVVIAGRKVKNAQQSLTEARQFLDITQKQEQGGEAAHADVIKAQIQAEQRNRDLQDAQLAVQKARIVLGVLIAPDAGFNYETVDDLNSGAALPPFSEVQQRALTNNPDVTAAQASLRAESAGVTSARAGYLPAFAFDYWYGIDANQVAHYNRDHFNNIGSAAQASMTIPVWTWGSTQSKVRQAKLRQEQARIELGLTQRQLASNINAFYLEAQIAEQQMNSLRLSTELAAESLRLTVLRYQAGEATALEVADAQTTLAQARNAQDDGLLRYRVALGNLQTLTGAF